jgi:urease accessory protein
MKRLALLATAVMLLAEPAHAHAPIKGVGAFYNGMLHPLIVPAHLLLLAGFGLLLGQHAPKIGRVGWFAFALALVAGLAAAVAPGAQLSLPFMLVLALIAAALVILDRPVGLVIATLLGIAAGIVIGLDSRPETTSSRDLWLGLMGAGIGAVLILSYVGGLAAAVSRPWQRIAVRAAGSWIAASALIVLSLSVFHA